jgi:uncharacterized protein
MPSGLAALLDDVAVIARAAAASVDDVAIAAGKASTKAAGVVIDDAAVTPQYVTGFTPDRELPIIWRIAKGSLFNKIVILLPIALILSIFFPVWVLTVLLMLGGAFLCFEGAEKAIEKLSPHKEESLSEELAEIGTPEHEAQMIKGAIRTDFILSAEIMAITLNSVSYLAEQSVWLEAAVLAAVAVGITVAVYGTVAIIVKMDDVGLHMAQRENGAAQAFGRALVAFMPKLLTALSVIGTAAMLWVGGQIIVHGFGIHPAEWFGLHDGFLGWIADAAICGIIGFAIGAVIVWLHHMWTHRNASIVR